MKLIARFILFLFIAFLSTPTIVTLIEKNTDVSMFYDFAEEENNKELKEIKSDLILGFDYPFIDTRPIYDSIITTKNLLRHDKISEEIFIPPPELI
jgi:hypothetical protein